MTTPRVTPRVQPVRKPGANPPPKIEDVKEVFDDTTKPYRAGKYKEPISQLYAVAGLMLSPIAPKTGMAFVENSDKVAEEWDKLSRTNPKVKKVLDKLVTGGGWGGLLLAHSAIGMVAVQESGLLSKVPFLKTLFPKSPEPEAPPTDDLGNPLPAPFERRSA